VGITQLAESGEAMKKYLEVIILIGLFVVSFIFFLFLTFPYEVLKETVAAELSTATGYNIQIGELGPRIPLGVEAGKVTVDLPDGSRGLSFSRISADVSLLSLLIGSIAPEIELQIGLGTLRFQTEVGVASVLGGAQLPDTVELDAKDFPLNDFVGFGINMADPSSNPMLGLLANIGMKAKLNGNIEMDLDADKPTQSSGFVNLRLTDALLILSHPMVGLADQRFKKALFKAKVESGTVVFDKTSGLLSDELDIGFGGKIGLQSRLESSQLNLEISIKLAGEIQKVFGWIIGSSTNNPSRDSQCVVRVNGPMGQPNMAVF
jgi:type II secretion system protein N